VKSNTGVNFTNILNFHIVFSFDTHIFMKTLEKWGG
jgi:hypothetical protein